MKRIVLLSIVLFIGIALATAQKPAEIKFDQQNHDFGLFSAKSPVVKHTFNFVNVGESPLVINHVVSSCGCATVNYSKAPIMPGQSGQLTVTYNGKGKFPGHFKKSIMVRTNGKVEMTRLYIEGDMEENVSQSQLASATARQADNAAPTQPQPVLKSKEIPNLSIVESTIAFADAEGTNTVTAGRNSVIRFQVKNTGKGTAYACKARATLKGTTRGISVKDVTISSIAPGETKAVELPITAGIDTQDGQTEFAILVDEPNGFGTDPQYLSVKTHAFDAPLVQITDYSLTAESGQILKKKQPFDLQLMLQNVKQGQADNVTVTIDVPQNVLILDGQQNQQFATLQGGETRSLVYSLIVNNNYEGTTIPVTVHVKEKFGRYAEGRTISLSLDQALASTKIAVAETRYGPRPTWSLRSWAPT